MNKYIEKLYRSIPLAKAYTFKELNRIDVEGFVYSIMDDSNNIIECDLSTAMLWRFLNPRKHIIKQDHFHKGRTRAVSTVFIGMLGSYFRIETPFKTVVVHYDGTIMEYLSETHEDARENHEQIVALTLSNLSR